MREWFLNLSLREKQTVTFGTIIVFGFLIYALLWLPLNKSVIEMRNSIQQNQELLAWMQSADKKITALEKTHITAKQNVAGSLLSTTQNTIKASEFTKNITELKQADKNSVKLSLANVEFDNLADWLTKSWKNQGLNVSQMSVKAAETPGLVSASITFIQ